MVNLKEAVQEAKTYIKQLFSDERIYDLLLEELEKSEDEKYWLVTLGFDVESELNKKTSPLEEAFSITPRKSYKRVYRTIKIDSETGEMVSMKGRRNI